MPTTTRLFKKQVSITSKGVGELEIALRLLFGDGPQLYWKIDGHGFNISDVKANDAWTAQMKSELGAELLNLAVKIQKWIDGLGYEEARAINGSWPTEETYTNDPGIDLAGFHFVGGRSLDGRGYEATVIPGWV